MFLTIPIPLIRMTHDCAFFSFFMHLIAFHHLHQYTFSFPMRIVAQGAEVTRRSLSRLAANTSRRTSMRKMS